MYKVGQGYCASHLFIELSICFQISYSKLLCTHGKFVNATGSGGPDAAHQDAQCRR